jgi:hypothetical protein
MVLRVAVILAVSALASLAQTSHRPVISDAERRTNPAEEDLLRSQQKRFPPEVWSERAESRSTGRIRSYCVYPSLEIRSIAFRRCSKRNKILLFPSLKLSPKSPAQVPERGQSRPLFWPQRDATRRDR